MEAALNLCWGLVTGLLCAGCLIARRRGVLRVSFATALACSLLLAVLLFPAISMTDDLQRVNLEAEVGLRTVVALLQIFLAEPMDLVFAMLIATLLAFGVRQLVRLITASSRQDRLPLRVRWHRPAAVRPPTAAAFAAC